MQNIRLPETKRKTGTVFLKHRCIEKGGCDQTA